MIRHLVAAIALLVFMVTAQGQGTKQKLFNVDSNDGQSAEPSSFGGTTANGTDFSVASRVRAGAGLVSWSYFGRFNVTGIPESAQITKLEFRVWATGRTGSDPDCSYYARWFNVGGGAWNPATQIEDASPSLAFQTFDITDYPNVANPVTDEQWHVFTATGTNIPIVREGYVALHLWDAETRPLVTTPSDPCIQQDFQFTAGGHVSPFHSEGVGPQLIVTYTDVEGSTPVYTVID